MEVRIDGKPFFYEHYFESNTYALATSSTLVSKLFSRAKRDGARISLDLQYQKTFKRSQIADCGSETTIFEAGKRRENRAEIS